MSRHSVYIRAFRIGGSALRSLLNFLHAVEESESRRWCITAIACSRHSSMYCGCLLMAEAGPSYL